MYQQKTLNTIGGISALLQFVAVITLIVVTVTLGPKLESIDEYFSVYQQNPLVGFLRDDLLNLILITLYLGTVPALYSTLKRINPLYTSLATLFTFIAVTVSFAGNSDFSMYHLSDQYSAATSEMQRIQIMAAGEAIIASDMWHSMGGYMVGILLQGSGMLISIIMLKSSEFSKITAIAGLLGNGFDLLQHLIHPFAPAISESIMIVMGPFYLAWFPLLARDLFRLRHISSRDQS